ncbi:MAG: hypothetical protein R6U21_07040 [Thermoplasmatota archaeon]
MNNEQHIHCKAEIIPHPITYDLTLQIIIDKNHAHFSEESNTLSWQPTTEEQRFLKKVFDLFNAIPSIESSSPSFDSFFDDLSKKQDSSEKPLSQHQPSQKQQPQQNTAETIEKTIEKHQPNTTNADSPDEKINHIINKQKSNQ